MAQITSQPFEILSQSYVPLEDVLHIVYAREKDRTPRDYETYDEDRGPTKYPPCDKTEEQLIEELKNHESFF